MTTDKALKVMAKITDTMTDYIIKRDGIGMIGHYSEELEALKMARDALKAQGVLEDRATPKRVDICGMTAFCPRCGKYLGEQEGICYRPPFCDNCGQALEWNPTCEYKDRCPASSGSCPDQYYPRYCDHKIEKAIHDNSIVERFRDEPRMIGDISFRNEEE